MFDDRVEFRLCHVGCILCAERRPLFFLVCVVAKFGRKSERHAVRRQFGASIQECFSNLFGEGLAIEREPAGKDPQIVEIIRTAVGNAKLNHRLDFFRAAIAPRVA